METSNELLVRSQEEVDQLLGKYQSIEAILRDFSSSGEELTSIQLRYYLSFWDHLELKSLFRDLEDLGYSSSVEASSERWPNYLVIQKVLGSEIGETSDGYHTFNELYEHRHALFLALMAAHSEKSWFSEYHSDGEKAFGGGWIVAGIQFGPDLDITYHLPTIYYPHLIRTGANLLEKAPEWDGHTANDVVSRLLQISKAN